MILQPQLRWYIFPLYNSNTAAVCAALLKSNNMANVKMNSLRKESEKTEIQHRIIKMNITLSAAISTGEQDFFNKCE